VNCTKCNNPLEANARFCPNCGELVSNAPPNRVSANPMPSPQSAFRGEPPTIPPVSQKNEPLILRPGQQDPQYQGQAAYPQNQAQPWSQPAYPQNQAQPWSQPSPAPVPPGTQQPPYYQPGSAATNKNINASTGATRPRRRGRKFLIGFLITLLVLVVLVGGGWFFALRPYLNSTAQNKLDSVLTDAVNNIPPPVALLPSGPVTVTESTINNLLAFNASSNDIVQNTQVHITPQAISLQFQVFGFTCTVTGVPAVVQGKLVFTNVTVDGIAGLIFSPDDITALANRHLAEAQTKIQHSIQSVQLNNQQMILVLGSPGASPTPGITPTPGGIPFPGGTPPVIP
jgi:hypothetical protein